MTRVFAPFMLCILLVVSACATKDLVVQAETLEQQYFVTLAVFDEYDRAALSVAQNPETPAAVVSGLKTARAVARAALDLAVVAYGVHEEAKYLLMSNPNPSSEETAVAALQAFTAAQADAFAKVTALRTLVEGL